MTTATTTDYSKRSDYEAKTYELLDAYLPKSATQAAYVMAPAIRAMWSSACPADKWVAVAIAIGGNFCSAEELKAELTRMVRAKVLRSRKQSGVTFYEVNF